MYIENIGIWHHRFLDWTIKSDWLQNVLLPGKKDNSERSSSRKILLFTAFLIFSWSFCFFSFFLLSFFPFFSLLFSLFFFPFFQVSCSTWGNQVLGTYLFFGFWIPLVMGENSPLDLSYDKKESHFYLFFYFFSPTKYRRTFLDSKPPIIILHFEYIPAKSIACRQKRKYYTKIVL